MLGAVKFLTGIEFLFFETDTGLEVQVLFGVVVHWLEFPQRHRCLTSRAVFQNMEEYMTLLQNLWERPQGPEAD